MKSIRIATIVTAMLVSSTAFAQGTRPVSGTVEKVDTAQGKITIDHGPIRTSTWRP